VDLARDQNGGNAGDEADGHWIRDELDVGAEAQEAITIQEDAAIIVDSNMPSTPGCG